MVLSWLDRIMRGGRRRRWQVATLEQLDASLLRTGAYLFAIFAAHTAAMMGFEGMIFGDALWLTLTTATTVGYGDMAPTGLCRGLAVSEAVTGYILLGMFVAAAVALYARNHEH